MKEIIKSIFMGLGIGMAIAVVVMATVNLSHMLEFHYGYAASYFPTLFWVGVVGLMLFHGWRMNQREETPKERVSIDETFEVMHTQLHKMQENSDEIFERVLTLTNHITSLEEKNRSLEFENSQLKNALTNKMPEYSSK
jgi:hypothetical protein